MTAPTQIQFREFFAHNLTRKNTYWHYLDHRSVDFTLHIIDKHYTELVDGAGWQPRDLAAAIDWLLRRNFFISTDNIVMALEEVNNPRTLAKRPHEVAGLGVDF